MSTPQPAAYTLLFKSHRTTVLLSAIPGLTLSEVRTALYTALTGSSPQHITSPLPPSPESIVFGLPRDPSDWSKGWYPIGEDAALMGIDIDMEVDVELGGDGGGGGEESLEDVEEKTQRTNREKEKSQAKGRRKGKNTASEWTVEKVGLRDGSIVAYFVKDGSATEKLGFVVEVPVDEEVDQVEMYEDV